jgi:hypothetical protein
VIAFFPVTPRIDLVQFNRLFHRTGPTRTWLTKKYNRRKSSFQITISPRSSRRRLARRASSVIELGISAPKNLILLIGGADRLDEKLSNRLTQLFSRGIARAAVDAEALIMDGGCRRE